MNLKEQLAGRGILCAHIVDDAFDVLPSYGLTADAAQHVLEIASDQDLETISETLGLDNIDEDAIRSKLQIAEDVQKLFAHRDKVSAATAAAVFHPFDLDREGKTQQLQPLIDLLENSGVKCIPFGANYDPVGSDEPQLFFVDLKLKEGTTDVLRHEDAVRAYQALKAVHPECKPFVFLMSSLTLQLGAKRELFRRDADLFQSEFEGIDKAAFTNGDELARVLESYTKGRQQLATLREKMKHVELAVAEATNSVMRELRALDLADYFILYHNTTSIEKVNLGSYVIEMLLEFLAHEVEGQEQVWDLARGLDSLNLRELPRARFGMTLAAAKLYSANMLHSNAMLLAEDRMQRGPSQGYFFTGDIFIEAQALNLACPARAFVIVTPACDLARLEQLKGRSILLCEGSVSDMQLGSPLVSKDSLPLVVMPHPRDQDRYIVVEWNKKKLHVWDDSDRVKFAQAEQCSFVRIGRLRPVYALQMQNAVTSDLSRIGTQRPPSALIPHGLVCFVSDGKSWHQVFADGSPDAAALSDSENGKKKLTTFVFADPTMHKVMVKIASWVAANPTLKMKSSFEKVLADDARDVLRGFQQRVPEKAQKGKELDITAYPFEEKWAGNEGKFVAVVRNSNCSSPYCRVADGQEFRTELQARVVFRLESAAAMEDSEACADNGILATT